MTHKTWCKRLYFCACAFAVLSLIIATRVRPVSADSNFFLPGNLVCEPQAFTTTTRTTSRWA